MAQPKYIVDTSSFAAMRHTYSQDVFPGAWAMVSNLATSGILLSVEPVYKELEEFDDDIFKWARANKQIFLKVNMSAQVAVRAILSTHPNLLDPKKPTSIADPFVIAAAQLRSCAVVTEERPSGGPNRKKIPDVCLACSIPCIKLLDLFRAENLKL
jgi:hypothetical protein